MFQRICKGVRYIHNRKIAHLDLKSTNIFIGKNFIPKIGDFGWATEFGKVSLRQAYWGEQQYMAPETFDSNDLIGDPKIDIWTLGIILYELFHFKTPYESLSIVKM